MPDDLEDDGKHKLPKEPEGSGLSTEETNPSCASSTSHPHNDTEKKIEKLENKKPKTFVLPPEKNTTSEKDMVGDDSTNRSHASILCECHPNVSGAGVPVVTSFISPEAGQSTETPGKSSSKSSNPEELFNTKKGSYLPKRMGSKNGSKNSTVASDEIYLSRKEQRAKHLQETTNALREKHKKQTTGGSKEENANSENASGCSKGVKLANRYIYQIKSYASSLKESNSVKSQKEILHKLLNNILELKRMAETETELPDKPTRVTIYEPRKEATNLSKLKKNNEIVTKSKDNKIRIKLLPTKSGTKKKVNSAETSQKIMESNTTVETSNSALSYIPKVISDDPQIANCDSMDGVFIPTMEAPTNLDEDEDETDGLDITITFPEYQQTLKHPKPASSSHLSVCFSDISADALGKLRRCPKDFTLRMDFVQGKMFFQSGKEPINTYAIGPNLKIRECVLEPKMSEIINIKPSTECLYASQIIPVETTNTKSSVRVLKSTDGELISVVGLTDLHRMSSVTTKSCVSLRRQYWWSIQDWSDGTHHRSMPQIPSLPRFFEIPLCKSVSKIAFQGYDRRRRYLLKRKI